MDFVESDPISAGAFLRGVIRPLSRSDALDPFLIKTLSKLSPRRLVWTAQSRLIEIVARMMFSRNLARIRQLPVEHRLPDRGGSIANTAVTSRQCELLLRALDSCAAVPGDVAEIGAYRGVTTCALAQGTSKRINAVDPFIGYGGAEGDLQIFLRASRNIPNIRHIRKTSGNAAEEFPLDSLAFVFIDAVHDFSNSWFDFSTWSQRLAKGGFIALHDVDEHVGVTLACRKVCRDSSFRPWAYCPNLIIFQRI